MTHQQAKALQFIKDYIAAHGGVSPSYREIMAHLGVVSASRVHDIVHALADQGRINFRPDKARSIELLEPSRPIPVSELIDMVYELAGELETEVEARYQETKNHPAMTRRYERDIEPVKRARALIAQATRFA